MQTIIDHSANNDYSYYTCSKMNEGGTYGYKYDEVEMGETEMEVETIMVVVIMEIGIKEFIFHLITELKRKLVFRVTNVQDKAIATDLKDHFNLFGSVYKVIIKMAEYNGVDRSLEQHLFILDSKIKEYLTTPINSYNILTIKTSHPSSIMEIEPVSHLSTTIEVKPTIEISVNAIAQRKIANEIKIHDCVEYGSANPKRQKEVAVAGVSRTDTQEHPDGHYCLASVKYVRQFASMFADMSVIISQDDKAKVGLRVPAVGQTFRTLQSINEPVVVSDHDFLIGYEQKLIPSVYLMIKPNELTDELRTGQLAIFIRPQWPV
ncbi:16048_t:CDS:2, partial [Cetraspora pellucida]